MTNLELKSKDSALALRWGDPAYSSDIPVAFKVAETMRLLKEFAGALLGGVGVAVLIGNLLISGALLLRGPAYLIELLAK